ncbi:MAG: threonylcarbamoyl-AMP synthase [Parcubacteria group bacterium]|nr:threonylcarbamoyl-AMP synthase [Parcubacteria group bacterium]
MEKFKRKVLMAVEKIKKGKFLTYREVAQKAGRSGAYRAVGNLLARNRNPGISCHRIIQSSGLIGGYKGGQSLAWRKLALLLKEGVPAVMPTDTIYGICGSALNKSAIEKIYALRKRNFKKPMIVLISDFNDLKILGIKISVADKKILKKIWPAKISVILRCPNKKFNYLHRGTKKIAVRMPKSEFLTKVLEISGPLVAPSANWEGEKPAKTIAEAKKYFGNKVVYYDAGKIAGRPSTLLKLKNGAFEVIRK